MLPKALWLKENELTTFDGWARGGRPAARAERPPRSHTPLRPLGLNRIEPRARPPPASAATICEYQDFLNLRLTGRRCASANNMTVRWHWDSHRGAAAWLAQPSGVPGLLCCCPQPASRPPSGLPCRRAALATGQAGPGPAGGQVAGRGAGARAAGGRADAAGGGASWPAARHARGPGRRGRLHRHDRPGSHPARPGARRGKGRGKRAGHPPSYPPAPMLIACCCPTRRACPRRWRC
jgi:hypothetical protein